MIKKIVRLVFLLCLVGVLGRSTYATTNYVQCSSELTSSCQTCLHHVENCHPRVELNPRPYSPKSAAHISNMERCIYI